MATILKLNLEPGKRWFAKLVGQLPLTFRTKRDAEGWGRRIKDEMVRGIFIQRSPSEKMCIADALDRYSLEVIPTKKASTQVRDARRVKLITAELGKYSLAALSADIVAEYRDRRLAAKKSNNTVRLELALLGHLYTCAIREWGIALPYNPVSNIRKPAAGPGRSHRITREDHARLLAALREYSNPMLAWIYEVALETSMRAGEILNLKVHDVDLESASFP